VALVIAGPSGSGKTTVCRRLLRMRDDVAFSVSATTRAPRAREEDGRDYHFLSRERFEALVEADELLEWATVHGELYGTPRRNLREARAAGKHLLLDIDVQGARQVRTREPSALLVFLLPPDADTLLARLRGRGSEPEEAVRMRMYTALDELSAVQEFDQVIVNEEIGPVVEAVAGLLDEREVRVAHRPDELRSRVADLRDALRAELADGDQPSKGGSRT
jgi:guanylate kinase